jgi:two-component system, sensor histidine kinase and response regulator
MTSETPAPTKVLVVDDIAANLVAMQALLAGEHLQILTAGSGAAALELLLQHDVALALLDVQMPAMDGYQLAELMRGSERTRSVPIIFLTAGQQEANARFRGYEAGAVDFLYKPLDENVLRRKVAVFVELHRQRLTIAEHAAQLARLAHANALMLASLSNDLGEPLTALALNAEVLAQRAGTPPLRRAAAVVKSATALLRRQVDHLVGLARAPQTALALKPAPTDLAALAHARWRLGAEGALAETPGGFASDGDAVGIWDSALLERALDTLMLQAEAHAGGTPMAVAVDGTSRGAVVLRIAFERALSDAAARHLLGSMLPAPEGLTSPVGPGLLAAERIARAHGGSLVGRSNPKDGTTFELMLPRGMAPQMS